MFSTVFSMMGTGLGDQSADLTLAFGSRSGTWLALALFGTMFAVLGYLIRRAIRQRSQARHVLADVTGWLFFVLPLLLVYATSFGGFYDAELSAGRLRLRYLTGLTSELAAAGVTSVTAVPAFKGRWRLRIVDRDGRQFESATWHREPVHAAAASLSKALNLPFPGDP